MKKRIYGRKFQRDINERKALFNGLISSLVVHESIQTTEEKAKAIKGDFDKLVTKAKKGGERAYTLLQPHLTRDEAKKMIEVIGPRFMTRPGGYTRIIRLSKRFSDNAQMVMLELVEKSARGVRKTAAKVEVAAQAQIEDGKEKVKAMPKEKKVKEKKAEVKKQPKEKKKAVK